MIISATVQQVLLVVTVKWTLMTAKQLRAKTMQPVLIKSMDIDATVFKDLAASTVQLTLMTAHQASVVMGVGV